MGWGILLVLVILSPGYWASAQSPPSTNTTCVKGQCGMGTCKEDRGSMFGFSCECQPGWTKLDPLNIFSSAPCIIPNCTINFSCSNTTGSASPPRPPPPPPSTTPVIGSLLNPCLLSQCGEGDCVSTAPLIFNCNCRPGYSNLLNISFLPCVRECSLGADCLAFGLTPPSTQSSPPASVLNNRGAFRSVGVAWIIMLCSSLLLAMS